MRTNARETTRINFLAHLILAAPTDASRVGNLLGDFVRGTPESLRGTFPDEVLHGVMMPRHLDFIAHKQSFDQAFLTFFPDVQKESARLLRQPLLSWL